MHTESPIKLQTSEGQVIDLPADGMLGLLALGAEGIKAWRATREVAAFPSQWAVQAPSEAEQKAPIQNFHTQGVMDHE